MRVRDTIKVNRTTFSDLDNGATFTFEGEVYICIGIRGIDYALQLSGGDSGWANEDVKEDSIVFPIIYDLIEDES